MSENDIESVSVMLRQVFFHDVVGCSFCPVALQGCCHFDIWKVSDGIAKATVPLIGWRGSFQTENFHDLSLTAHSHGDIFSHLASHLIVVGTDESGKFLRVGLAFEDDDWHAAVVGAVDGRRDAAQLVRSYDEQVYATGYQAVDLLALQLAVVVSGGKGERDVLMEIGFHAHFCILPVAPDVL